VLIDQPSQAFFPPDRRTGGDLDELSDTLTRVPVVHLGILIVVLPGVAAAAAWLVGGREPLSIARQATE